MKLQYAVRTVLKFYLNFNRLIN